MTKLEALVQELGMTEEEARSFLDDAGEDPDEELPAPFGSPLLSFEGETLKKFQDTMYKKTFGEAMQSAQGRGACVNCKQLIHWGQPGEKGAIYTHAGKSEYRISGVCETCFDAMFREPEEY